MSDYYAVSIDPDFLEHHGVEGQQWGKRNGPPYPLDAQGKAELKAQKKEYKAKIKAAKKQVMSDKEAFTTYDKRIIAASTIVSSILAGPLVGATVGAVVANNMVTKKAKAIVDESLAKTGKQKVSGTNKKSDSAKA